eukprot:CAMPEP_0171186544 /NCGR_PEP_ID=MMETSP0790-20130122/16867_1 /TAXON_ID=2925 /ORGANISM="Alexandrium catenella, Strain OF101" /LENGTH=250 /DNA_ID=CAMNT_0011651591 /DNA_START=80 /DNA_END=830 /DNA_ORIENTATION=-
MMLAAARRFAAAPLTWGAAALARGAAGPARSAAMLMPARGAAVVTSPRPLSIRMDSLFVKCFIAAVIYFGPQDAVFLGGLGWFWHSRAAAASPKKRLPDAAAAVEEFKAKKGLDDVKVVQGGRTWRVGLARAAPVGRSSLAREPLRVCSAEECTAMLMPARGAAAVTSPRPLSIRMDSLFVKCFIAAVIYFGPQDAVFLGGLGYFWHSRAAAISPKKRLPDAAAAVEEFKAKKGLEDVKVSKGGRTWSVG